MAKSQSNMKQHFDKNAMQSSFQPGDSVLFLLPVPGSALQARFAGPYVVEKRLSDTDHIIGTPGQRLDTYWSISLEFPVVVLGVCHIYWFQRLI